MREVTTIMMVPRVVVTGGLASVVVGDADCAGPVKWVVRSEGEVVSSVVVVVAVPLIVVGVPSVVRVVGEVVLSLGSQFSITKITPSTE